MMAREQPRAGPSSSLTLIASNLMTGGEMAVLFLTWMVYSEHTFISPSNAVPSRLIEISVHWPSDRW